MQSFDIPTAIGLLTAGFFTSTIALIIIDIVFDERKRRKQIKEGRAQQEMHDCARDHGRFPLRDPEGREIGSVGYIFTKHNGSKTLPKGQLLEVKPAGKGSGEVRLVTIIRRGKAYMITEAQHEKIKKQNREKMRTYRAKKRAELAGRKTKQA